MIEQRCLPAAALLGSVVVGLLAGCTAALDQSADFDRHRYSQLVQPFNQAGMIYFDVKFAADFPARDPAGDAARGIWLKDWLVQRRLCPDGYDVVERRPFDYLEDNPAGYDERWEIRCRGAMPG